jgi:hypothetical protein
MRVLSLVTINGIYFVTITVTLPDAPVGAETVSLRGCASVMAKRGDFMRCPWGDSGLLRLHLRPVELPSAGRASGA